MAAQTQSLTALSQALRLEQEGRAFYLNAAKQAPDERCEKTLLALADDERLHAEMVQRQLHSLEGEGQYVLLPGVDVTPIDLGRSLFPPDAAAARSKLASNATVLDILHVALENEIASYDLYRHAAQGTEDEIGRQMYTWLASAELTHFNLLMANYEALSTGGTWL
jgi:rubrerythrin